MDVGFIGLGKLGFPCALALESKGHKVIGYDINPDVEKMIEDKKMRYKEIWAQEHIEKTKIKIKSIEQVVKHSEVIFLPIQTPHDRKYEGDDFLPEDRKDFDYSFLKTAVTDLSSEIEKQGEDKVVIIISTVLPGTIEREIKPLLGPHTKLCYNPFFIAMGTTMKDFLDPEFVLFGVDDKEAAAKAKELYSSCHDKPFYETDIKSAELIKVAYNTYIGMKIVFANTMMEICHHTGADVDQVTGAMGLANERIMSTRYLSGGMGDGGGCHPRDNIAMSWLAKKHNLSFDFFEALMVGRQNQTWFLCEKVLEHRERLKINKAIILGKSFKPETNIVTGSPAILARNILENAEPDLVLHHWDPYVDGEIKDKDRSMFTGKGIYLIGTKHPDFKDMVYPAGSVIIDPWRYIPDKVGVKVIRVGEGDK
tara:strand:- start:13664 stop:14932 length:1269 start_codon:yes stop_codon:yes gene_type:complete